MRISDWSSDVCSSDLTRCCGSQPVSAVAEPLSSSALRKAWETKGLSPAQASHAAAGTSAMRLTTFTARLSLPSGMVLSPELLFILSDEPGRPPDKAQGRSGRRSIRLQEPGVLQDRKSTRLNSSH